MTRLSAIDAVVLLVYLAGVVGFGCWFVRRSRSTGEFMAAGGRLPGWAVGLSIFGTYVSSISFLANPGKSYAADWNPFVFGLSLPLAAWIASKWFVPFYRRGEAISAYDHLEQRFGPWARTYAVVCYLLTQLARMGTIIYLVALALSPLTGWSVEAIIVATGILVTLYTLLGGIEAVIWTDVVQSVVLTVGAIVCIGVILADMPEGPQQVLEIATGTDASAGDTDPPTDESRTLGVGKFSLGSLGSSLTESTFWVVLIYGLFINLQNFGIDQSYVQRYITACDEPAAKRSVWLGALAYLPISALLFLIGTALFAYYTAHAGRLPDGTKADAVFPHFIANELPDGLSGLLIAAVLAAAMSSVDSSLNSSATLFLCDIYRRYVNPQVDERRSMRVLYSATLVFGAAGTAAAIAMTQVKSALDAWWKLAGVFGGGMLGLFLLGRLSQRAGSRAALIGVALGVTLILWMSFSQTELWPESLAALRSPFHGFLTIVFGTATILIAGLLCGRMLTDSKSN